MLTETQKPPRAMEAASGNTHANYTAYDAIDQFRQAIQAAGIAYSGEIIPDGKLHRFHIDGQRSGTSNGVYVMHTDGCPAGYFEDWKTGIKQTWRMRGGAGLRACHDFAEQIAESKRLRDKEIRQRHAAAAERAKYIWSQSKPIADQSEHAYLVRKHIQPHGARLYKEALAIPLMTAERKIENLQFISPSGEKRFLTGGKKRGLLYPLGKQQTPRILLCEGFATGATLHEETEQCVAVAFDAGNLLPVAEIVRELAPKAEIIICGDNDLPTKEFPFGIGQTKAREAALAIGAKILIPDTPGWDWNDAGASRGGYRHD